MNPVELMSRLNRWVSRSIAEDTSRELISAGRRDTQDSVNGRHGEEDNAASMDVVREELGPNSRLKSLLPARLVKRREADGSASRTHGGAAGKDPRLTLIQNQCLKLSLGILGGQRRARSLGFISAIPGEGKTFLASLTATALAERSRKMVTLVDCNWENPSLHVGFKMPNTPGLAEWLRQECDLADIRRTISPRLTVIPAGDALDDVIALTDMLNSAGLQSLLDTPDEVLIADLPAVLTSAHASFLAQQMDAVLLVVRSGVTQDSYVAEATGELSGSRVEGAVLNAVQSKIPRWIQRLL